MKTKPIVSMVVAMLVVTLCAGGLPPIHAEGERAPAGAARLGLVGDPDFDPNDLAPDMRLWYDRLWLAISSDSAYPNPDNAASSGDLYLIGRSLNNHVTALLTAFRVTGDLALLEEADRLMELARAELRDDDGDGFMNWRWLYDDSVESYYGNDYHKMDEILAHSLVAAVAYALRQNEQFNPIFGEHADFWTDHLGNDFLGKWEARGDDIDKSLAHPYSNFMRLYYYLYRLTGDEAYLDEANYRADVLDGSMIEVDTGNGMAFTWDHRVVLPGKEPWGCQPTTYSLQTVLAFQDMHLENFNRYADDVYMTHYMVTFRELVLQYGTDAMAGNVCGEGEQSFGKFTISSLPALAIWDNTGTFLEISDAAYYQFESPNTPRRVFIPAYMLLALDGLPPVVESDVAYVATPASDWASLPAREDALP
ncbi:MAG: hypothetical protein GYB65_08385 [Chloroflexi bacterium]|nr:hypothetical protein [Chloroflexota bacterium]